MARWWFVCSRTGRFNAPEAHLLDGQGSVMHVSDGTAPQCGLHAEGTAVQAFAPRGMEVEPPFVTPFTIGDHIVVLPWTHGVLTRAHQDVRRVADAVIEATDANDLRRRLPANAALADLMPKKFPLSPAQKAQLTMRILRAGYDVIFGMMGQTGVGGLPVPETLGQTVPITWTTPRQSDLWADKMWRYVPATGHVDYMANLKPSVAWDGLLVTADGTVMGCCTRNEGVVVLVLYSRDDSDNVLVVAVTSTLVTCIGAMPPLDSVECVGLYPVRQGDLVPLDDVRKIAVLSLDSVLLVHPAVRRWRLMRPTGARHRSLTMLLQGPTVVVREYDDVVASTRGWTVAAATAVRMISATRRVEAELLCASAPPYEYDPVQARWPPRAQPMPMAATCAGEYMAVPLRAQDRGSSCEPTVFFAPMPDGTAAAYTTVSLDIAVVVMYATGPPAHIISTPDGQFVCVYGTLRPVGDAVRILACKLSDCTGSYFCQSAIDLHYGGQPALGVARFTEMGYCPPCSYAVCACRVRLQTREEASCV